MARQEKEPLQLLQVGVGTILSSMSIAGFLLGYATDIFFGTLPLFLLIFGFLGVLGGIMKAHRFLINVPGHESAKTKQRGRQKH
ncbi:MAG TPA: AtpZ/AtpI family protein [Gammaproteobacteria bacterium]|nr:AtpZ/AtpI family protein [Gammaproteobacteria bacterium]